MNLFLHLTLSETYPPFSSDIRLWIGEHEKAINYFDVDNQSDPVVIQVTKEAIDKADRVFVWVESQVQQMGSLMSIFTHLAAYERKGTLLVVVNGESIVLEKLQRGFKTQWVRNVSEVELRARIRNFFTSQG